MRGSVAAVACVAVLLIALQWQSAFSLESLTPSKVATSALVAGLLISWLLAPWIAARLSQPKRMIRDQLTGANRTEALRYARVHWAFFSEFVTAQTHWLAPDNFQSDPEPVVAMRTSPTNIGLQLLATVSALDLGFISLESMTNRLEQTMGTMLQMAKYRGHFYNWYDLHDLHVLSPVYVSTVDSGNLAGYLVALRQACLALAETAPEHHDRLQRVANQAYGLTVDMDFTFLYDQDRKLFTIGYHPESFSADDSFYDLLASEARLASFIAIAKNDVPVAHWFRLSRDCDQPRPAATGSPLPSHSL
jgi:cyclic beta-1,2-glucan synthetase